MWTVPLQGTTPRCSAGALSLYQAPRGRRNVCSERPHSELQVVCVCVPSPSAQCPRHAASVCSGDGFVLHHRPSHRAGTLQHRGSVYGPVHPKGAAFKQTSLQNCVCLLGFMLLHIYVTRGAYTQKRQRHSQQKHPTRVVE